jgi:hypothetical protein
MSPGVGETRRTVHEPSHTEGIARATLRIEVSAKDQKELRKLVSGGVQRVRVVVRALALL